MTIHASRGSAAVIAMIVLAFTGLTVTAYVTSSTSAAAADVASVGGWRALYATDAGVAAAIASVAAGGKTAAMPPIDGVPTVTIQGSNGMGFTFFAVSAQSRRHAGARVTIGGAARPVVTEWALHVKGITMVETPDAGNGGRNGNGNNGNGNGNGGGNGSNAGGNGKGKGK